MQPIRREGLTYSLSPVEQKAIESKMFGRKVKNWIKPAGGVSSIVIAAVFAGAIIAVALLKPKFEKSVLGISLGSTAGVCFVVGSIGGVILFARHGHAANKQHKLLNFICDGVKAPKNTDEFLQDILTKYKEIPENDLMAEEKAWIEKLKKALKIRARAKIIEIVKENSKPDDLKDLKKKYIELSGLTFAEIEADNLCLEHLLARGQQVPVLFPGTTFQ